MSSTVNTLFSRFGVELEYMLVRADSLAVAPAADQFLHQVGKDRKNEMQWGDLRLSNELVLHVLEFKTDGPVSTLDGLAEKFQAGVRSVNECLARDGLRLLPGAMHPWMDPFSETQLWPHGDREIYDTFNRIFDCRGHGWSNLQSTHLNLPFSNDTEFAALHEALRTILPLVPAIAASSPFHDGGAAGVLDARLVAYRENCARIPSVSGRIVPEPVASRAQYERDILGRIYADLAPLDPGGILREEWVNARGTIARFDRGTIELRVMDVQECPAADLAILQFLVAVTRELVEDSRMLRAGENPLETEALADLFERAVTHGLAAEVRNAEWLQRLGLSPDSHPTMLTVVQALADRVGWSARSAETIFGQILRHGNLATRLQGAVGAEVTRERLVAVYTELADCLEGGRLFLPRTRS